MGGRVPVATLQQRAVELGLACVEHRPAFLRGGR